MASSSKELITLEAYAFYSWRTVGENKSWNAKLNIFNVSVRVYYRHMGETEASVCFLEVIPEGPKWQGGRG